MIDKEKVKAFISHILKEADEGEIEIVINAIVDVRDLKALMRRINLDLSSVLGRIEKDLHDRIDEILSPESKD